MKKVPCTLNFERLTTIPVALAEEPKPFAPSSINHLNWTTAGSDSITPRFAWVIFYSSRVTKRSLRLDETKLIATHVTSKQ